MAEEVKLPQLGESVTEGTITAWLVDEGEEVQEDQPLFEISTDKVDTEVPSPASGVLKEIRAQVDDTVEVGEVVAVIDTDGEAAAAPEEAEAEAEAEAAEEAEAEAEEEAEAEAEEEAEAEAEEAAAEAPTPDETGEAAREEAPDEAKERQAEQPAAEEAAAAETREAEPSGDGEARGALLSPIVRRLVEEHDLDPSQIEGTGKGGRITREDVERAVQQGAAAREEAPAPTVTKERPAAPKPRKPAEIKGRSRTEKLSRIRQAIAKGMWESLQTTAQLTAGVEVDVTNIMRLRGRIKDEFRRREGVSLSPLPFFARAVCMTLPSHPSVNAAIDVEGGTATYYEFVNLGIAVDTEQGLIVPNIKGADDLTVPALAREIADLAERTRNRKLQPDEVKGGTFTITNTGSRGAVFDTPILNPPEVAILATPKIVKRPMVIEDDERGDVIAVRHMSLFCLTYDHRMVDGADAARFLTDLEDLIQTHDWATEIGWAREYLDGS